LFGRWTVLARAPRIHGRTTEWMCRCDCGTERVVGSKLKSGQSTSCGCQARESLARRAGIEDGTARVLYSRWQNMHRRVSSPGSRSWHRYGARGITVCERWQSFENFAADMGPTFHPDLTLERIDNDGSYSPENCRWATRKEQQRNTSTSKRVTFRGHEKTTAEWSELLGIDRTTLLSRLRRGWSTERALTTGANPDVLSRIVEADG
jgi:hypothetical protein